MSHSFNTTQRLSPSGSRGLRISDAKPPSASAGQEPELKRIHSRATPSERRETMTTLSLEGGECPQKESPSGAEEGEQKEKPVENPSLTQKKLGPLTYKRVYVLLPLI